MTENEFPHMHEMGAAFEQVIYRAEGAPPRAPDLPPSVDAQIEDLITLSGWDFESQYIYEAGMELKAGDWVKTTCTFANDRDERLRFGEKTKNEMCFNFAYISPPIGVGLCNQGDPPLEVYIPGSCAPESASEWSPPLVNIQFATTDQLPANERQAPLPASGAYTISDATIYVNENLLGRFSIDLTRSEAAMRGAVLVAEQVPETDPELSIDVSSEFTLFGSGIQLTERLPISYVGNWSAPTAEERQGTLMLTCGGDDPISLGFSFNESDELIATLPLNFGPLSLTVRVNLVPM